jgi:xanthine dehydrogenase accessory factor
MAVAEDNQFTGSVSAGCVEADVFEHAQQVIRTGDAKMLHFGISDEQAFNVGLSCGGEIDVWVQGDWLYRPEEQALANELRRCLRVEDGFCLITILDENTSHRRLLVHHDGAFMGTSGSATWDAQLATDAQQQLDRGTTETRDYTMSDGTRRAALFDCHLVPPTLLIFGGTHVAVHLVTLAKLLGFRAIVVDGRPRFAATERFPGADHVILAWPDQAAAQLRIDASTYVAVLNHDPKFDEPALKVALSRGARYVGAIGSRKTREQHHKHLRDQGITEEDLARVHGPIGLDIGARTPEETALAVMAEVIAVRRGRPGGMMYQARG